MPSSLRKTALWLVVPLGCLLLAPLVAIWEGHHKIKLSRKNGTSYRNVAFKEFGFVRLEPNASSRSLVMWFRASDSDGAFAPADPALICVPVNPFMDQLYIARSD
jgi:hypothetical protein